MKGYRKISDGYIEVTVDEVEGEDLNDNLKEETNSTVTAPILHHAEKTHVLEYKVVIYAKKV